MPISQRYAITVTLKPRLFGETAEQQYDRTAPQLHMLLGRLCKEHTLVAETTKQWNIHYHGTCIFDLDWHMTKSKNCAKRFVDSFRKHLMYGFVMIKPVTEEPIWTEYLGKNLEEFETTLSRRPIIHDGLRIFPTGMFTRYGIIER